MSAGGGWVVVSGAAGSLGSRLAPHFAASGRRVLALDREPCRSDGPPIDSRAVELTSPEAVRGALNDAIPAGERIALLINAVGMIWNEPVVSLRGARFRGHDVESFRRVLDANLTAPFVVATEVALRMARTGGGAIINFSSISAAGNAGQAAYSAAKAGLEGLTRAMAAELGPLSIRVNAIAPGFFDVSSTRAALSAEQLDALQARTPLRRLGADADLIAGVELLAANEFVTGAILDINGGLRL
jgi:3-oxoacyl-[acyl-carrier protein] reductase